MSNISSVASSGVWTRRFEMKIRNPTKEDLCFVMENICNVPNVWAFCQKWEQDPEKHELFNKFMDMCAWFRKDESYLNYKKEINK